MVEVKPVVRGKREFETRDESVTKDLLTIFGLSRIHSDAENQFEDFPVE